MIASGSLASGALVDPWHVMRYVSGLPRDEARRRVMVVLQAFVDESGNYGDSDTDSVYEVAGFISTAEKWQSFTDGWLNAGLSRTLKMNKALERASKGKSNVVNQVLEMIELSAESRVECSVHIGSYKAIARGKVPREVDNPYFFAISELCARIVRTVVLNHHYRGKIDIFADEGKSGENFQQWYELARCHMSDEYASVLPNQIFLKDDEEFLPLKTADFIAGLARRDHNDDVHNLEEVVTRINNIPAIDSPPLDAPYFQSLLASPSVQCPDKFYLSEWRRKWNFQ